MTLMNKCYMIKNYLTIYSISFLRVCVNKAPDEQGQRSCFAKQNAEKHPTNKGSKAVLRKQSAEKHPTNKGSEAVLRSTAKKC